MKYTHYFLYMDFFFKNHISQFINVLTFCDLILMSVLYRSIFIHLPIKQNGIFEENLKNVAP